MKSLADEGTNSCEEVVTAPIKTNAGREEEEGEQQPRQEASPEPEETEAQQRERLKADIRAHNVNMSFTK